MKINYDTVADAIYLKVKRGKISKTLKMEDRLIVDIDKKGDIIGIEMLEISSQRNAKSLKESLRSGIPVKITALAPLAA